MAIPLPEKIEITKDVVRGNLNEAALAKYDSGEQRTEFEPDDLSDVARGKYDAYYAERARRRDPTQPGVAQEALDALADCKANKRSTEELHKLGYSYRTTVKPAENEEKRVVQQLKSKASEDVTSPFFSKAEVAQVMTKHAIEEYVKPVAKEPVDVEPEPIPE